MRSRVMYAYVIFSVREKRLGDLLSRNWIVSREEHPRSLIIVATANYRNFGVLAIPHILLHALVEQNVVGRVEPSKI